jgi:iron complex transport system substrate-binding protein
MGFSGKASRFISALCLAIILSSCSTTKVDTESISEAKATTVTPTDKAAYSRVVAVANGSAEIISALGHRDVIIGRDIASTDKDLASIEIVTSGHQLVAERVLAKKPDLVIIDEATGPAQAIDQLKNAGVSVITISQSWSISDIPRKIDELATAIQTPRDGAALKAAMKQAQSDAAQRVTKSSKNPKIAFIYLRGGSAIYLIGGKGSGADSIISAIGATDVGALKLTNPFNPLSAEAMAELNPDLILVMSKGLESVGGEAGLFALPGVAQSNAGRNKRVIAVDDSLLLSFGPRTPDLLLRLASAVEQRMAS